MELREITSYGSIGCINFGCKKQKSTLALLRSLNYYYQDTKMFNRIQGQEGSLESTTVKDRSVIPFFALTSVSVHLLPSSLSRPALPPPQSYSRAQLTTGPATKRNKVVLSQSPNSKFLDTVLRFSRLITETRAKQCFIKWLLRAYHCIWGEGKWRSRKN